MLNTYRVWLVYELFRGSITAEQLAWCEKQMRDFVASRSSNNPHLRATVSIENMDANDLNSDHCFGLLGREPIKSVVCTPFDRTGSWLR